MELRKYFGIIAAYRWHLIVPTLVAALIALGATFAVSARYVGTAVVQIIPDETESRAITLQPQDGPGVVATGFRDPTELLAQGIIETLGSRTVAQDVAARLELAQRPDPTGFAAFKSQVRGWLDDAWAFVRYGFVARKSKDQAIGDLVEGSLSAELVRGSYYMKIVGSWRDPETAAAMANAAVQAVIGRSRQVASASAGEQRRFLETQVKAAQDRVGAARGAVLAYSRENVVSGESIRLAVDALESARAKLRENDLSVADVRSRLDQVRRQLAATPKDVSGEQTTAATIGGSEGSISTVSPNAVYQALQNDIGTLEQQVAAQEAGYSLNGADQRARSQAALDDARARLQAADAQLAGMDQDNPSYALLKAQQLSSQQAVAALEARATQDQSALDAQHNAALAALQGRLATARKQLEATSPTVSGSQTISNPASSNSVEQRTTAPNPVYQDLQTCANTFEQELSGLNTGRQAIQTALSAREQDVRDLTDKDGQLAALNQELTLATDNYSHRTGQLFDAMLEEARPVTQIRLVDPAVAPLYPAAPVKVLWAAIGALAGLLAGAIYVFVHYSTDISLRNAADVERVLSLPLLAEVPALTAGRGGRVIMLPATVKEKDER